MKRWITNLVGLVCIWFCYCQSPVSPVNFVEFDAPVKILQNADHPKAAIYQSLLENFVKKGIPGAVLLVATPQEGLWMGAAGMADLHSHIPMKTGYQFNIASVTKMVIATATLQILNQHNLSPDVLINSYLPSSCFHIKNTEKATVQQLLQHTSGIYDFTGDAKWLLSMLNNDQEQTWAGNELTLAYDKDAYGDTGAVYHYSNTGYVLAGKVLDSILGYDHHRYVRDSLFVPLGMEGAVYESDRRNPPGIVRSYRDYRGDGILRDVSTTTFMAGSAAGGIFCTISDLYLFSSALFQNSLLNDTLFAAMGRFIPVPVSSGITQWYGLGLEKLQTRYGTIIGHPGQNWGFGSYVQYFPEKKTTVILMVNVGPSGRPHTLITDFIVTLESRDDYSELYEAVFK